MLTTPNCLITSFVRKTWKVESPLKICLNYMFYVNHSSSFRFLFYNLVILVFCACCRSKVPVFSLFQTLCYRETTQRPHENARSVFLPSLLSVSLVLIHIDLGEGKGCLLPNQISPCLQAPACERVGSLLASQLWVGTYHLPCIDTRWKELQMQTIRSVV